MAKMMMSINQLMTSWDGYHTVSWSWKHMLKNVVVQSSICVHHYQDKDKVTAASLVASLQYMSPFSPTYLTFFYVPVHSRLSYLLSQHHSAIQYCTHYGHGWLWGGTFYLDICKIWSFPECTSSDRNYSLLSAGVKSVQDLICFLNEQQWTMVSQCISQSDAPGISRSDAWNCLNEGLLKCVNLPFCSCQSSPGAWSAGKISVVIQTGRDCLKWQQYSA